MKQTLKLLQSHGISVFIKLIYIPEILGKMELAQWIKCAKIEIFSFCERSLDCTVQDSWQTAQCSLTLMDLRDMMCMN